MKKFKIFFLFLILSNNLFSQSKITTRNLKNCIVFADVYGYAKYYYPTKKTTPEFWGNAVTNGLASVFDCKTDNELIDSLRCFFSSVAPEILFTQNDTIIKDTVNSKKKKFYYEHEGFSGGKIKTSSKLTTFLVELAQPYKTTIKHKKPIIDQKYYHTTYNNINIYVPYGLDKKHKIKNSENKFSSIKSYENIGAIIIAWNVFKNFYPYQENINADWFEILETTLKMVSLDTNDYRTFGALKYLSNMLNDGHARVFYKRDSLHYQPPFTVKIIDSNLYVNKVLPEFKDQVPVGAEIVEINNVLPAKLIDSLQYFVSSSTEQWNNLRVEGELLNGAKNSKLNLIFKENNELKEKVIIRNMAYDDWTYFTGNPIKLLDDSIYYLNVETLTYNIFKKNISNFNNSKGLIIDFRGYPKSVRILKHFKDTILQSPYWRVPYRTLYSIDEDLYTSKGSAARWTVTPSKKQINVPVVFLSDAHAISFSETCLDMIKYYELGTIIGQPTAGSNGNVIVFSVYHKYKFIFTGMKVINNDGELITKNGIEPNIIVPVTEEGLKNSKDEILLYGIDYIKNKK